MSTSLEQNLLRANELHQKAMDEAELAVIARLRGAQQGGQHLVAAFRLEREAAGLLAGTTLEPSRTIIHKSAATLALEIGEWREAERLVCSALAGSPSGEIAEELRDLWENIHFARHLQVRGVELSASELQMSLAGKAVDHGGIESNLFLPRIQAADRLLVRTGERKENATFREGSYIRAATKRNYSTYLIAPRPGSFAVTLHLGGPQLALPGLRSSSEDVIDEVFDCLRLVNDNAADALLDRIANAAYYRNFVALATRLAPDGKNLSMVGFTTIRNGKTLSVNLKPRIETRALIRKSFQTIDRKTRKSAEKPVVPSTIVGQLRFASSLKTDEAKIIILVDDLGLQHRIQVPDGMMSDIVKPLWEERVKVSGTVKRNTIMLEDIQPISEND